MVTKAQKKITVEVNCVHVTIIKTCYIILQHMTPEADFKTIIFLSPIDQIKLLRGS